MLREQHSRRWLALVGVVAAAALSGVPVILRAQSAGEPERKMGSESAWAAAVTESAPFAYPRDAFRPDEEHRVVSRTPEVPPLESEKALAGEADLLETLLKEGTVAKEVYESEMASIKERGAGAPDIDDLRGRLAVLVRLYHRGDIDTDTFLKHYLPLWDEWYHIDSILVNGDFEGVEDRKAPERLVDLLGWQEIIWGHMDAGYSQVTLDRRVKHRGAQSLRFTAKRAPSSIRFRSVPFGARRDDMLKIRFWAKAENLKPGYYGRTMILYFYKSDGIILWLSVPAGTYDWTMMEARLNAFGNVPEGQEEPCFVEAQFFGEGTLWLDDLTIVPTTRRNVKSAN